MGAANSHRMRRLSERERLRLLATFDEVVSRVPPRPLHEVEKEIREIRTARRGVGPGRRTRQ